MCIWQKHRRCHFHQRCGHSLDANFVKGQPSESRTKLLEYMGWSAQWRWWQINKQPLLLLINDQCWPFTQWWPCHRTQPKVLISVMLTQGVEPDRLRATIPPAPLNLLLCHPRSSFGCRDLQDYFSRSVSGTLPLWALIPLIVLPKKQILNKCISARQGLFFSRDKLHIEFVQLCPRCEIWWF